MGSKAAFECMPLAFRSPSMPFLYQTRTLAGLQWRKSAFQARLLKMTGTRAFGGTGRFAENQDRDSRKHSHRLDAFKPRQDRSNGDIEPSSSSRDGNPGLVIRRTTNIHGPEPPKDDHWGTDDGLENDEGSPSLIRKTWMVPEDLIDNDSVKQKGQQRSVGSERRQQNVSFDEFGTSDGMDYDTINFSSEDHIYEERDAIDELTSRMDPDLDRTSTITSSEKHIFQKVFSDIFSRQHAVQNTRPSLNLVKDKPTIGSDMVLPNKKNASQSAKRIMSNATKELSNVEMKELVEQYPVALRAAAARAFGFKLDDGPDQSDKETIGDEAMQMKLEELRRPERERVERLMRAAKTDFELWEVMEKEVFSLIPKLGLGNVMMEPDTKTVSKKSVKPKKKKKAAATDAELQVDAVEPTPTEPAPTNSTSPIPEITDLARDGPLYPFYLLLGLRLLDRSFAKPSLLTLSVLPKIKSLGFFSHVLGGTTQLYNELIIIHWRRRDDFPTILILLTEMEQSALDWDNHTLEIVSTIDATQKSALRGERGRELNTLWNLPAFSPGSFGGWREKISRALAKRELESTQTGIMY